MKAKTTRTEPKRDIDAIIAALPRGERLKFETFCRTLGDFAQLLAEREAANQGHDRPTSAHSA